MFENPHFSSVDPYPPIESATAVEPPAAMPPLMEAQGSGWSLSRSPEPTDMEPVTPDPTPPARLAPRDVAGYRDAVAVGVVRPTSADEPPTLLSGPSASTRAAITMWVPFVAWVSAILVLAPLGAPIGIIITWVAIVITIPLGARWRERRVFEELAAGYITVPLVGKYSERGSQFRVQPLWNYAGTWKLDRNGNVERPPDPSVDAPGFYPSPDQPGRLQLWTGSEWLPRFHDLTVPSP